MAAPPQALQRRYGRVAFGDGNNAPALAAADVGVAMARARTSPLKALMSC